MKHSKIHLESAATLREFRAGVSLHSHTLHSQETLFFLHHLAARFRLVRSALERGKTQYRAAHGSTLDLHRAWWTPPLAAYDAWLLERNEIQNRLGLNALVSLTDHDNIEGPLSLRVFDECRAVPVSVEWTVPYGPTFFHLGVHNLPPHLAQDLMTELKNLTESRHTMRIAGLLQTLANNNETLIVFNHPCWDENKIGQEQHMEWATQFARQYSNHLHALELNGLRPWAENRQVLQMASQLNKPVISGGDRHALEPNTVLDLTNAATFGEFVEQVRSGWTNVLVKNQYREPYGLRILQNIEEIMGDHANHGRGWRQWSDRVFYHCDDGVVRSLTTLFCNRVPGAVQLFVRGIRLLQCRRLRQTFRSAFPRQQEFAF
ncbi:MAG: hypothetical protein JOZ45_16705 [Acidobacteriaceae bacterium]|nr:hypothetical protein [Acidobacteriaceae bacterium]MBV9307790.1 hypothetical protein [Acidobacteriaceae bacterium]